MNAKIPCLALAALPEVSGGVRPSGNADYTMPARIDDPTEAAQLRQLRADTLALNDTLQAISIDVGATISIRLFVRDELPEGVPEAINTLQRSLQP